MNIETYEGYLINQHANLLLEIIKLKKSIHLYEECNPITIKKNTTELALREKQLVSMQEYDNILRARIDNI